MADSPTIGKAYVQIIPSMDGTTKNILGDLEPAARSAGESSGTSLGNSLGSKFKETLKAVSLGNIISSGVNKAVEMVSSSVSKATSRLDSLSKSTQVMTVLTGDAKVAQNVVNELSSAVTDTAYGLDMASSATQKFATSGMEISNSTRMVEDLMDAVSFYGDGTNATMENVADAISKMTSSGKISADQWQRLTDAGIPVLKIFSEQTGMTMAEVSKAFSNGEISAEEFNETLMTALEQGTASFPSVSGKAKEMSGSFATSFENMQARIAIGVANVIQSFNDWATDNNMPTIQETILNIGTTFKNVLNWLAENIPTILNTVMDIWDKFGGVIVGVATAVLTFKTYFTALNTISSISQTIQSVQSSFSGLFTVLSANPIMIIVGVIAALVATLIYLWNTNEDFRNAVTAIWESVKNAISVAIQGIIDFWNNTLAPALQWIGELFATIWNGISTVINTVVALIVIVLNGLWETFSNIFNTIWNFISPWLTTLSSTFSSIWNGISSTIGSIINGISSTISSVFNGIKNTISNIWNGIKNTTTTVWNGIKNAIKTPMDAAKNFIKGIIDTIKGFFNFNISWPKISLPHFSIKPKGWSVGDLLKGKIPSLGISWYAKAMDEPYMLSSAHLIGAGEAGDEVIYGHHQLMNDIREAVGNKESSNQVVINMTVNANENMDVKELANEVMDKINIAVKRKKGAFAL